MRRGTKRFTAVTISDPSGFADLDDNELQSTDLKRHARTWHAGELATDQSSAPNAAAGSSFSAGTAAPTPFELLFDAMERHSAPQEADTAASSTSTDAPDPNDVSDAVEGESGLHRPCSACRSAKVKCNREMPCSRCRRLGFICKPPPTVPRGRPSHHSRLLQLRAHENAAAARETAAAAHETASILTAAAALPEGVPAGGGGEAAARPPPLACGGGISTGSSSETIPAGEVGGPPSPERGPLAAPGTTSAGSTPPSAGVTPSDVQREAEKVDALRAQLLALGVQPCI